MKIDRTALLPAGGTGLGCYRVGAHAEPLEKVISCPLAIYGNEGGTKNAIRYMWSDKNPEVSVNNDILSEIRIHPNHWGGWMLE